jgi:hypothetical protein
MVVYKQQLYIGRAKPGFETRVQAAVLMLAQALPPNVMASYQTLSSCCTLMIYQCHMRAL